MSRDRTGIGDPYTMLGAGHAVTPEGQPVHENSLCGALTDICKRAADSMQIQRFLEDRLLEEAQEARRLRLAVSVLSRERNTLLHNAHMRDAYQAQQIRGWTDVCSDFGIHPDAGSLRVALMRCHTMELPDAAD